MKTLILVRHAKASPKHLPIPDRDRPLRQRGKDDLALLGPVLLEKRVSPQHIFTSTANRAAQTAAILAGFYGLCDGISFHDELYHPGPDGLPGFIRTRDDALERIMVVGHNPELEDAADLLSAGSLEPYLPTSACVCLVFDAGSWELISEHSGRLEFYEYPKKHRREAGD